MPCRQTIYARNKRAELIEAMGAKCKLCHATDPEILEFDHINGRDYNPNVLSYSARLARYSREFSAGLLRLLCADCNKAQRIKNENGSFARTEHADQVERTAECPY